MAKQRRQLQSTFVLLQKVPGALNRYMLLQARTATRTQHQHRAPQNKEINSRAVKLRNRPGPQRPE
jgi:hypothetical protein